MFPCHHQYISQGSGFDITSVDVVGDPFVVDQLKTHFQRLRPSDILNTYSFPSGHTTAAVFIMGNTLASCLSTQFHSVCSLHLLV